jgi:hypothetical protein
MHHDDALASLGTSQRTDAADMADRCQRSWAAIEAAAHAVEARASASWAELAAASRAVGDRAVAR